MGLVFSAEAAVGLAAGVGNVGDHLLAYEEGDTFLTNDGGVTWKKVRKGPHLHEFADWGAIVVLVNDKDPTQHVRYGEPPCHWCRSRFHRFLLRSKQVAGETLGCGCHRYSWNEGESWSSKTFLSDPLEKVRCRPTFPTCVSCATIRTKCCDVLLICVYWAIHPAARLCDDLGSLVVEPSGRAARRPRSERHRCRLYGDLA